MPYELQYELQDVVAKLNSIIELLSEQGNRAGNIVGGAVIDIIRGCEPRDFDVVIYDVDDLNKVINLLKGPGIHLDVFFSYDNSSAGIGWCIKTIICGFPVDFINWCNVDTLGACMLKFDFDINQAWIDEAGRPQYTAAAYKALETRTLTFNKNHEGISNERKERIKEKFDGFRIVGL
jgi:hypothetical protein